VFEPARLDIEIKDRFGQPVIPREWFLVPLAAVDKAVERIRDGTITGYRYDPGHGEARADGSVTRTLRRELRGWPGQSPAMTIFRMPVLGGQAAWPQIRGGGCHQRGG